jgi:hypothetical protein
MTQRMCTRPKVVLAELFGLLCPLIFMFQLLYPELGMTDEMGLDDLHRWIILDYNCRVSCNGANLLSIIQSIYLV